MSYENDMQQFINNIKIKLGRLYEFLESFIVEIEKITYGYPASKDHHHSDNNGLFIHSLEVADKMLEIFEKNKDVYLPKYQNEKTGEYQSRYEKMLFYVALAGLLHDIGKIAAYEIKSRWYYVPFISSVRDIPNRDWKIEGNKGVNYVNSNNLAGVVFGILLERAGKKYYESFLYDFRFITMMLEAINLEHYSIMLDNPILLILKKADAMSVAEERSKEREDIIKVNIPQQIKEKETRNIDLSKLYVNFFKQHIRATTSGWFYTGEFFLIINPVLHKKLVEQISDYIGQAISEDVIIDELIENKYTEERIVKLSLKLKSGKVVDFSVLKLKAEKIFQKEELENLKLSKVSIENKAKEVEL